MTWNYAWARLSDHSITIRDKEYSPMVEEVRKDMQMRFSMLVDTPDMFIGCPNQNQGSGNDLLILWKEK